jgi:hypothetical protein
MIILRHILASPIARLQMHATAAFAALVRLGASLGLLFAVGLFHQLARPYVVGVRAQDVVVCGAQLQGKWRGQQVIVWLTV